MKPADILSELVGEPHPIDCANVRKELSRIWGEGPQDRVRLSTMNLVMVVNDPADLEGMGEDLQILCEHYPARVYVAVLDKESMDAEITGWYTMGCRGTQVYNEQVTFHIPSGCVPQLPSLLAPLYQMDQPIFLWWRGKPGFEESIWERMIDSANRIVVDTSTADGLLATLNRQVRDPYHQELAFSDLEWTRQSRWRNLLAGLYDKPDAAEHLKVVTRLEIGFVPGPTGALSAPFYMAGWLAAKLGWHVSEPFTGDSAKLRGPGGRHIELHLTKEEGPEVLHNRLLHVRLESSVMGCSYGVSRKPDNPRVYVSEVSDKVEESMTQMPSGFVPTTLLLKEQPKAAESDFFMPFAERRTLIAAELEVFARQPLFEQSLAAAAEILGAGVSSK
jgi:glucose-6-phosphate dehydrogenase assembly protein OpcA